MAAFLDKEIKPERITKFFFLLFLSLFLWLLLIAILTLVSHIFKPEIHINDNNRCGLSTNDKSFRKCICMGKIEEREVHMITPYGGFEAKELICKGKGLSFY